MRLLLTFLRDVVVSERDCCLCKFLEELGLFKLLSCLKSHLDVATLKG